MQTTNTQTTKYIAVYRKDWEGIMKMKINGEYHSAADVIHEIILEWYSNKSKTEE